MDLCYQTCRSYAMLGYNMQCLWFHISFNASPPVPLSGISIQIPVWYLSPHKPDTVKANRKICSCCTTFFLQAPKQDGEGKVCSYTNSFSSWEEKEKTINLMTTSTGRKSMGQKEELHYEEKRTDNIGSHHHLHPSN